MLNISKQFELERCINHSDKNLLTGHAVTSDRGYNSLHKYAKEKF